MPSDYEIRSWVTGAVVKDAHTYVRFRLKGKALRIHRKFVLLTLSLGRHLRVRAAITRAAEEGT